MRGAIFMPLACDNLLIWWQAAVSSPLLLTFNLTTIFLHVIIICTVLLHICIIIMSQFLIFYATTGGPT